MNDRPDNSLTDAGQLRLRAVWIGWCGLFLGSLALYGLTAARGAQWQDSGHFILRIVTGQLHNELGLALAHPLHFYLGRAFAGLLPTDPAYAITLVSAVGGAITVANVFGLTLTLTRRLGPALLAAGSLALAHTFWRISAIAECYTVTTALLSAELWCLVLFVRQPDRGRWFALACLFNGLGVANHMLAALTSPLLLVVGVAFVLRRRQRGAWLPIAAAAWVAGAMPYLVMIGDYAIESGSMGAAVRSALFGNAWTDAAAGLNFPVKRMAISAMFTALSFPNLLLPLAALGLVVGRRIVQPSLAHALLAVALVIHLVFVIRYDVVDQHTFYLPTYLLVCVFGGVGMAWLGRRIGQFNRRVVWALAIALLLATPLTYAAAPALARHFDALGDLARHKPYRDDYRYLLWPWAVADRSAERMAEHAVDLAEPDDLVIVEDPMGRFAVQYALWRVGREPIVLGQWDDQVAEQAAKARRAVVLVPRRTDQPPPASYGGTWDRDGPLYRWSPPAKN